MECALGNVNCWNFFCHLLELRYAEQNLCDTDTDTRSAAGLYCSLLMSELAI